MKIQKSRHSVKVKKLLMATLLPLASLQGAFGDETQVRKGSLHCELRAEAPEGSELLPAYQYVLEAENAEQNTLDNYTIFSSEPLLSIQKIDYVTGKVETIVSKARLNYLDSGLGHSRYTAPFSIYGLTLEFGHIGGSFSVHHNVDGIHEYFGFGSCFVL